MRLSRTLAGLAVVTVLAAAPRALAQDAVGPEEAMAAMHRRMLAFVGALTDYTREVRLSEADVQTILAHAESLDEIDHGSETDGVFERAFRDGRYDFDALVREPEYAAWCRGRGLEPRGFFRNLLRLEALIMRELSLAQLARAREDLPAQRKEVEQMRGRMGEEGYKRTVAALEATAAMAEEARQQMEKLPSPTAVERALLEAYRDEIRTVLGSEDEADEAGPAAAPEEGALVGPDPNDGRP